MGRKHTLRKDVLDALFDGPHSVTELVSAVRASRQGVIKTLKSLMSEGLVEKEPGKRGMYMLTEKGYSEHHSRREMLVYDEECEPKLLIDPVNPLKLIFYEEIPAPTSYHARLFISEKLGERIDYDRRFFTLEHGRVYQRRDVVERLTQRFVNEFFWEYFTQSLFDMVNYELNEGEELSEETIGTELSFSAKLSLSLDFTAFQDPEKKIVDKARMKQAAALMILHFLNTFEQRGNATCVDIIRFFERRGWAPKGWTKLLEAAVNQQKIKRRNIIMHKKTDNRARLSLIKEALETLRSSGKIDEKSYKQAMKIHGRDLHKFLAGLKPPIKIATKINKSN
ncbi:hypothetical protein HRbin03_00019 [archaeon HR03]|nr:hypothetical protein HRbin03_00019 [archaeon HR03]